MKNPWALLGLVVFAAFEPKLAHVFFTASSPQKAQKRILELEAQNERLRNNCAMLLGLVVLLALGWLVAVYA